MEKGSLGIFVLFLILFFVLFLVLFCFRHNLINTKADQRPFQILVNFPGHFFEHLYPLASEDPNIYMNHVICSLSFTDITNFHQKLATSY